MLLIEFLKIRQQFYLFTMRKISKCHPLRKWTLEHRELGTFVLIRHRMLGAKALLKQVAYGIVKLGTM